MSPWKTNRLRVLRATRRLTQHDVAQRTGMSQSTYWKYENAYAEPTEREKKRIARVLRVDVEGLVEPAADPPSLPNLEREGTR